MVGSWVLDNKTLIAFDALEDGWLLHRPFTNVGPFFIGFRILLLGMGDGPSGIPFVSELFEERSFDSGRLHIKLESLHSNKCVV